MQRRTTLSALGPTLVIAVTAAALAAPTATYAEKPSGHHPSSKGWDEADKTGFGTARGRQSKVWFTLEGGRVSEVFYPDLSTPSIRNLELTVTDDGHADRQGTDMTTTVSRPDEQSLRYTLVSTDTGGHHRLTGHVRNHPANSALAIS